MSEWQPIETAPKDGTVIDVWVTYEDGSGKRVVEAFWRAEPFGYEGANGFDISEGWAAESQTYDCGEHWICNPTEPTDDRRVTHWMPIPESPK